MRKNLLNRILMSLTLITGIGLCFLCWYGAALFHTPEIDQYGTIDFSGLIINSRMDMAVWNTFARSLWAVGVGLIVKGFNFHFRVIKKNLLIGLEL